MKDLFETPKLEAATCSHAMEEALNLYMDGELPFAEQPVLFAHLATCDPCRRMLGAMMEFRRMSRQEVCPVPPAFDEAFFRRLDEIRGRSHRVDRYKDRRPLWQTRAPVSLRVATMAAVLLFCAGFFFPQTAGEPLVAKRVELHEERVVPVVIEPVYVITPGVTVEAPKFVGNSGP